MTPLDALPPWATTGVGSLPFDDPRRAAEHAVFAYDLPFCPQMPHAEGDMIAEWLGADPGRCGWSPQRDRERPLAWGPWLAALRRSRPLHGVVKLQVTGPATLACALHRSAAGPPSRADALGLAHEVASWLAANVSAQRAVLSEHGLRTVLVVDEPALAVFGIDGVETVWDPLRATVPAWGLHLCCTVPWGLIDRVEPDLLSFDLAHEGVDLEGAAALERLLRRGGRVAWGVLQPHRPEHALHGMRRLSAVLERLDVPGDQSLVTASCGTGRMSAAREASVATAVTDVAGALRRRRDGVAASERAGRRGNR